MSTTAHSRGAEAEEAAARFLEGHGLSVVARNYRTRFGEIDLVARDGAVLVFVEVRARRSAAYGGAAASVGFAKQRRILCAARHYLGRMGGEPACRFDVLAWEGHAPTPTWIRGAFDAS